MVAFMAGCVLIVLIACVTSVIHVYIEKSNSDISYKHYRLLMQELDEIREEMRNK